MTFPDWCRKCCTIKDKITGLDVPFVLNAPQRRVAELLEADRLAGRPMRLIILKARQWGCSTLIQAYMAWMQLVHRTNWHSVICSQVKDTSATLRGMYAKILATYPRELLGDDPRPEFRPFEGSRNVREITGRGCRVTISSIENQDNIRGADFAMAHLSEVAYWKASPSHTPEDLIAAVCSSVASAPDTLIVMESTANGPGNFFHREWLRCSEGAGDKRAVFVPWYEIDIYSLPLECSEEEFRASLDPYELRLLEEFGCSLPQINWYRHKRLSYQSPRAMMSEFPTTAAEAFANSGSCVFAPDDVEVLRADCRPPLPSAPSFFLDSPTVSGGALPPTFPSGLSRSVRNIIAGRHLSAGARRSLSAKMRAFCGDRCPSTVAAGDSCGFALPAALLPALSSVSFWAEAVPGESYVAAVDIGGRSERSDFSVISVLRRPGAAEPRAEVVAQWRGHLDHDLLASLAASLSTYYNMALLVVESNSLDASAVGPYVLQCLSRYPNLYTREKGRAGFHTNVLTKPVLVSNLLVAVREHTYIERSSIACDEMLSFTVSSEGKYSATPGAHDDVLISRALALTLLPNKLN